MNDFHQKILEARIKQSNREWLGKRILLVVVFVILAFCGLLSMCSPSDTDGKTSKNDSQFGMLSNDAIGLSKYSVNDPSGYYKVVCTEGHGFFTDNKRGYMMAADEYIGKQHETTTYVESVTLYLEQDNVLRAKNDDSTSFRLEFYYIGKEIDD